MPKRRDEQVRSSTSWTKNRAPKPLNRGDAEDAEKTYPKGFRAWPDVDGSWKKKTDPLNL